MPSKRSRRGASAPSSHRVDAYAAAIVDGTVVAGPYVRLACARHLRDRGRELTADFPYRFDAGRADECLDFFETVLRLPDVLDEDQQPQAFLLQPFQAFIVGSLFGWVDGAGFRRFREAYIEIGKGNGKTPLCAGIGLFGLLMDGERAAEIYAAAADQDQAGILFRDVVRIVDATPELRATDGPLRRSGGQHVWEIKHPGSLSFFRMFSRESGAKSGTRPHMALLDELHEHPTPEISIKIRAGAKRRRQPLFVEITNAGFDRTSVCWQHHEHSRKVVEGTIEDDRWFAYVCALDPDDDPLTDERCWPKANPALGTICTEEYLRRQVETARHMATEANYVLRLNFCVWTQANNRIFDAAKWAACAEAVPDSALEGRPCFGAIDLGQSDDLSAWVRGWQLEDGRVAVRCRFWLPAAAQAKYPDRPYAMWARTGALTITEGDVTDFTLVQEQILADVQDSGVRVVGFDRRFAVQMAQNLQGHDITMVQVPQGFELNEAIRLVIKWVADGVLAHGGDPVLTWMADNAVVRHGINKQIRLDKDAAKDKIDGIVALAMMAQMLALTPSDPEVEVGAWVV